MSGAVCGEQFDNGIAVGITMVAPLIAVILGAVVYHAVRGFGLKARSERRYHRAVGARAAALMELGIAPYEANLEAQADMEREARAVLAA